MNYYKAKLTTSQTKKGMNKDLLIIEARNPVEAMKGAVKNCADRGKTKGSPWFIEDLTQF